jgi:hypothetical protein
MGPLWAGAAIDNLFSLFGAMLAVMTIFLVGDVAVLIKLLY